MFLNLTIAGSICSARKAAKEPKSSCQAATCYLNLFMLEQKTKKENYLTKLKSLNLSFLATNCYTKNVSIIVDPAEQRFLIQFTKCMIRKCQQVTVNIKPRFNFTVFMEL